MAFNETAELERSLLYTLTKSVMMCRKYIQGVKIEWFTSEPRKFIFILSMETFLQSRSILTEKVFKYEIDKKIEQTQYKYYLSEWNIIQEVTVSDPVEVLSEKLSEAALGRRMMDAIERVVLKAEAGKISEAVGLYKQTAISMNVARVDHPIVDITDYQHRLKLIRDKQANPEKYLGIKTGFDSFDRRTGGLFAQELTLIAGVTGLGKSTLVKQLQKGIITLNHNKNVLHIANEESQIQVETKFDALFSEIPYLDFKLARMEQGDIDRWIEVMEVDLQKPNIGHVYVKEVPAFTDVTLVEQAYRELEAKGIKIDVIIIDHLPHIVPILSAWGENDEKAKAAADCKQLAKDLNCSVVIPTQAATEVEEKQSKGKRAGKLDVYGSKAQVHVANTFIIITDKGKVPDPSLEEWEQDVNWLADVKKNRDGPPFCFRCRHYVKFGKVVETFDKGVREKDEEHASDDDEIAAAVAVLTEEVAEASEPVQGQESPVDPVQVHVDDSVVSSHAPVADRVPSKSSVLGKMRSRKLLENFQ